jgi:hypothetical protein
MGEMKIWISRLLCLIGIALPLSVATQSKIRMLRPGTFMIAAPTLRSSEQWFALGRRGDAWELIKVVPKIIADKTVCSDQATRIVVDSTADVLFIISGIPNLSPGPITTVIGTPRFLYPGQWVSLNVQRADGVRLGAFGTAIDEGGEIIFTNYVLSVRRQDAVQVVAKFSRSALDNPRQIVWAGDLDRDLRPDLLFDFPLGDVGTNYELFLSTAATGNEFVRRVATFATPGC